MPLSIEQLAQQIEVLEKQVNGLTDVVEAQEKTIQAHTKQNKRLEEHGMAIAVTFTAFAHILATKGIVARLDIITVLQELANETRARSQKPEAFRFLAALAKMVSKPLFQEKGKSPGPSPKH